MTLPKYLYHYTSQAGLLGILQTKKLWMTNILYLNDSSEFTHTLDLVRSEVTKYKDLQINKGIRAYRPDEKNFTIDEKIYDVCEDIENYFHNFSENIGSESYIFSLSIDGNDLNQWRGYCSEGGFSIGFDTTKLSSIIDKNKTDYEIVKCIYDTGRKEELIKSTFDLIQTLFESDKKMSIVDVSMGVCTKIIIISPYIKHESFKDEQEYRIICQYIDRKKEYREGKSMVIPYIEFSPVDNNGLLPINKIFVGPTPHPELSKLSVENLLKSEKYKGVKVETSKIPYRSW